MTNVRTVKMQNFKQLLMEQKVHNFFKLIIGYSFLFGWVLELFWCGFFTSPGLKVGTYNQTPNSSIPLDQIQS